MTGDRPLPLRSNGSERADPGVIWSPLIRDFGRDSSPSRPGIGAEDLIFSASVA